MFFAWLSLLLGLGMLVAGGELLVHGASRIGLRLGMKPMLVGLTIVAFGTLGAGARGVARCRIP